MVKAPLLIVDNCLSAVTGVRAVAEDLAVHLQARGWPVLITSSKKTRPGRFFDMIASVWKWRREYRMANVVVYSGLAFFWAETICFLLRRLGKPYVLTLQGGNLPVFARRQPRRVTRLLNSAVEVVAPSRYLREQLTPYRAGILLFPNPINLGNYPYRERTHPEPGIIWVRAFHHLYNPSLAPRAIALLTERYPEIHLTMIGPDKGDGSLQLTEQTVRELGLSDRVSFTGAVRKADLPAQIDRGDIFLNTTTVDNTPVTVLEAMACGLCVVSTDVGGMPYLIDHRLDGWLVPSDDPAAMAEAIGALLDDHHLAAAISRQGRRKTEGMDWSVVILQWENILRKMISPE